MNSKVALVTLFLSIVIALSLASCAPKSTTVVVNQPPRTVVKRRPHVVVVNRPLRPNHRVVVVRR